MNKLLKKYQWELILLVLLIILIVVFGIMNPRFLKPNVLFGSINDFLPICIISLAVTFVMITGGIDIQVGSIVGLTSIVVGLLWQDVGMNIWLASFIGLLVGVTCGTFSGVIISRLKVQPMVITLGGSFLFSGVALAITTLSSVESYKGVSGFPAAFLAITKTRIGPVPVQFLIFIVLIALNYILLHRTKYGRKIFLTGVNRNSAELSGINTKKIIASTYAWTGLWASFAGIILTSYLGTAKADFGSELTLPIITAVVLGGTSNFGGRGNVLGTALAALIIGILRFGLSMNGVNTQYLDIPVGLLLIISLMVRTTIMRKK